MLAGLFWPLSPLNHRRALALSISVALGSLAPPSTAWAKQTEAARLFDQFAPTQTAAAVGALSTQSQTVINELAKFKSLPIELWKFYQGDVDVYKRQP